MSKAPDGERKNELKQPSGSSRGTQPHQIKATDPQSRHDPLVVRVHGSARESRRWNDTAKRRWRHPGLVLLLLACSSAEAQHREGLGSETTRPNDTARRAPFDSERTAPDAGDAAAAPEPQATSNQEPGTFAITLEIANGDPQAAYSVARSYLTAACRARFPKNSDECRDGDERHLVTEFHVLTTQPLMVAAYIKEDAMARASHIRQERHPDLPLFRYSTCRDDPRFENNERISDTIVVRSGAPCTPLRVVKEKTPAAKLAAIRAIVLAEQDEDSDGGETNNGPRGESPPSGHFMPRSMTDEPDFPSGEP